MGWRPADDGSMTARPPIGECDLGVLVDPNSGVVRTTVSNGVCHPACDRRCFFQVKSFSANKPATPHMSALD